MPTPIVPITEVLGRADAGISSNPFRCRGEDGKLYYVKLGNALPSGLIAEWICAHLAREIGLPIADFTLVSVSRESARNFPSEYSELGSGTGFGSLAAPVGSCELSYATFTSTPQNPIWSELLSFDAWILNEDRKLSHIGGNPNTLYVPADPQPILIIDHDSAFDEEFNPVSFSREHLAGAAATAWLDSGNRSGWLERAQTVRQSLDKLWATIPESWLIDPYGDPIPSISKTEVEWILDRPFIDPDSFWDTVIPRP